MIAGESSIRYLLIFLINVLRYNYNYRSLNINIFLDFMDPNPIPETESMNLVKETEGSM